MCLFVQVLFDFQHWKMHSMKLLDVLLWYSYLFHMGTTEKYLINIICFGNLSFLYIFIAKTPLPQRMMVNSLCLIWVYSSVTHSFSSNSECSYFKIPFAEAIFHVKINNLFPFLHNQALQLLSSIISTFWNEQNQIILGHSQYFM